MPSTEELAEDFLRHCKNNPTERFWQALRNWSDYSFIGVSNDNVSYKDTFYFREKDK